MKPTHNNKKPGDNSGLLGAVFALAAAAGGAYMLYKQTKDMNDGGLGQQRDPNVNNRNKTWIPTQKSEEKKPGTTTFDDVAGIDEAIEEVKDIVGYLKDPSKAGRLGGKVSRGVLLEGPPGNGKTLLARAMAGEANVPFYEMPGSAFVEKYVGVGASRVRSLFDKAKKNAPCIIFIDEIDAVGRHRSAGSGEGGARESDQTLNQLLTELDGFQGNTGVIIIGATNRSDVLDPALLRPGRFDTQVVVPVPDIKGREDILNIYLKNKPVAKSVDSSILARSTPGFSGAQLADLVNKAALTAEKADKDQIEMEDFSEAREKILMGGKRNAAMTEEEAKLTAYHEAGHTIIGKKVKGNDPVHKVTIIPRGRALGVTMSLPEKDKLTHKKSEMKAMLAMLYGGRVAEQKIFGDEHVTTGASSDITRATDIARAMVTDYGMADSKEGKELGRVRYSKNPANPHAHSSISPDTQKLIDREVVSLTTEAETLARDTLDKYNKEFENLAQALLKYETLDNEEIDLAMAGKPIGRPDPTATKTQKKTSAPKKGPKGPQPG